MKYTYLFVVCFLVMLSGHAQFPHDLHADSLAKRWDDGIPLGNGMLGALVWEKEGQLRFSLDRADLWDQRPMKGLHRNEFSYQWVEEQVAKKQYDSVQKYFDYPYDHEPAPSKIPGGALQFDTRKWGKVVSVHLYIEQAICKVKWSNGIVLKTFVHATDPIGWFRFENVQTDLLPDLIAPRYQGDIKNAGDPVGGDDLSRLGYRQGNMLKAANHIHYDQEGWGGFQYSIDLRWQQLDHNSIEGVWTIGSGSAATFKSESVAALTKKFLSQHFLNQSLSHAIWWKQYWNQSSIQLPDSIIEKQWYIEQYKFGSTSRRGAPPISLQAIWTADNGRLPPWKGDYHHDLNTQLSYWPAYSANHLEEAMPYLDHLDQNKTNYQQYTADYFKVPGLNVPGVTTLDGTEMGGWIQYSFSPTVSAWLSHHYYLQWRYSMDRNFLKTRAYPWLKQTAIYLENITMMDSTGHRKLPISSSPEINDNSLKAWFHQNTNYDLALMKFSFTAAAELAAELGLKDESLHWKKILGSFGDFALSDQQELLFAPGYPYHQSHRHFSNMMAIHPLGLIKWEDGPRARTIIQNSIHLLDSIGPSYWCGYSYSWLANLKARAKDGAGAAKALNIFATAFCATNSFHLNGDQTASGYSSMHYRPFTLEGNFAFAAGLQEMLLQSHAGMIEVFPAVPATWKNISFTTLRAEGAFLVSAKKENGRVNEVTIVAEKGGSTKLKLPFKKWGIRFQKDASVSSLSEDIVLISTKAGARVVLSHQEEIGEGLTKKRVKKSDRRR